MFILWPCPVPFCNSLFKADFLHLLSHSLSLLSHQTRDKQRRRVNDECMRDFASLQSRPETKTNNGAVWIKDDRIPAALGRDGQPGRTLQVDFSRPPHKQQTRTHAGGVTWKESMGLFTFLEARCQVSLECAMLGKSYTEFWSVKVCVGKNDSILITYSFPTLNNEFSWITEEA